jgi:phage terminase large subunit GpA-like protein
MGARDAISLLIDADALVAAVLREFAAPPPLISVSDWAEANRILSAKDSAEPGPYRVNRTPYARLPMDCLSQHSPIEEVVLMWGAQTSKTTIGMNWLGYLIDANPGPIMIAQPTIDMAKRFSRQRLAPMLEESPALRRKVRENRSRDDANTTLLKEFAGGFMAVAGANSAAGLRSMPVRDLFLDEVDGYPLDVDGEGDPCMLAEARQSTFARRKRLRTSTPTTKGISRVEAAYLGADQCQYHVPCPHCGGLQVLEWGADKPHGIKWDKLPDGSPDRDTVRYVCAVHGCEIREHHKSTMLRDAALGGGAQWVAGNPGAQGGRVRSFHLSSLYAPLGWLTWAQLADEWHKASTASRAGDPSLLRVFVNTRLAETYEDGGDKADEHALRRRAADYPLRTVPHGGLVLTAGVDVQGDRLEAYAWAWGRGEESWIVEHLIIYGDPALPETEPGSPWAALTEWRRLPLTHAHGTPMHITATAVDSGGHHTDLVYRYARRHAAEHVIAVKGASTAGRAIIGKPTQVEFNHRGDKIKGGAQVWLVGTDTAKSLLYGRLQVADAGPGYVHLTKALPGYVFEQITAERRKTTYIKGHPRLEWVKPPGKRNEALDCAVYAMAAAWHIGVPRHTEHHWQRYEMRLRQPDMLMAPPETANPLPTDGPEATIQTVAQSEAAEHQPPGPPDDGMSATATEQQGPQNSRPPGEPGKTARPATPPQDTRAQPRPPKRPVRRGGWVTRW